MEGGSSSGRRCWARRHELQLRIGCCAGQASANIPRREVGCGMWSVVDGSIEDRGCGRLLLET